MKTFAAWVTAFAALFFTGNLHAQVPQLINYQGRVAVGGVNFDGAGQFKFALVNGDGTATFWSNDGTSTAGSQPTAAVTLTVTKGLYSVLLGDTALTNMTAILPNVFNNSDVRLRVWFNDGTNGSQQLAPDQRIAAVGYAMIAGNVSDGAITVSKIANGAVSASKLATGAAVANLNASGQSGVASGGLVLSATDNNSALTNAGYVKVGTIDTGGGGWQQRINTPSPENARYNHTAVWTGSEMIIWGGLNGPSFNDGGRYNPATNRWTAVTTSGAPSARTSHSAVWTGSEMIIWGGDNGSDSNSTVNNGGRYNPASNIWTAMTTSDAPSRRSAHRAVWTGSEMIVWGGTTNGFNSLNDGGRYDPAANAWTAMEASGAPSARQSHTAVWTGSEMIVWGGFSGFIPVIPLNDGRRYRPADNTWTAVTTTGAPTARYGHTAVWTGGEMIVWGGINGSNTWNDGGRYDPVGDSWTAVTTTSAPAARAYHKAIWTGSEMIVWGGSLNGAYLNDGGRYNPSANSWTAVTTTGSPAARWFHTAVWTGSAMIVWGGINATTPFNDGGRYNPVGNSWTAVAMTAPAARRNHTAVWTGSEMIVWGGNDNIGGSPFLNDGGRYNPVIDGWAAVNTAGAPAARAGHTAVWSGTEMIVWGGSNGLDTFVDGGRYNPAANTWAPVTATGAPSARFGHTAVWTGNLFTMLVWGGIGDNNYLNTGGVYNPSTNSWTAMPINAFTPAGRIGHSAVWTGEEMIVWGGKHSTGVSFQYFNDGGRFRTGWGSGLAIPTNGAPSAREGHSAVWTGNEMIIWGGTSGAYFNSGGRYNPTSNTWMEFLTYGAPVERAFHKALWTGKDMIVWGGSTFNGSTVQLNDGGRYDGTWAPIPASGGPPVHAGFTAVWTGTEMLLWGGSNFGTDIWVFKPNTSMFLYQRQ